MPTALQREIRRVHAWFSLFEYPLTAFETWKWISREELVGPLLRPTPSSSLRPGESEGATLRAPGAPASAPTSSMEEVMREISEASHSETVLAERQERYVDAMRKMKKLRRAVWYLSRIPGVRGIYAVNTLGFWHTRETSDIDLFIRVAPGSVWTARFFSVLPFALLKQRPEDGTRDPFCFSFFADTTADLASVALPGGDPYLSVWQDSMVPVFEADAATTPPRFVEAFARRVQTRLFPASIRERMNKDTSVVVNDAMLKFHDIDRRAEYRDKWLALCNELDCAA